MEEKVTMEKADFAEDKLNYFCKNTVKLSLKKGFGKGLSVVTLSNVTKLYLMYQERISEQAVTNLKKKAEVSVN